MDLELLELLTEEDLQVLEARLFKILQSHGRSSGTPKRWLNSADVKAILQCSATTLKNYRDKGQLPFSQAGENRHYYYSADVDAMLETQRK